MSVPLKTIEREDIRKLETALLLTALYSKETIDTIEEEKERITSIDSLYIAAAFAREKAGIPTSKIADEIGITEDTIRRHLRGETKARQLINT